MIMATQILPKNRAEAIVRSWRVDPLDTWRREQAAARFAVPAGPAYTNALASEVTAVAQGRLAQLGLAAVETSHKSPFDLLIDGCLKAELKAANWTGRRYQANLKPRQRRAAHVVLFAVRSEAGWAWFIIPTNDIQSRTIEITTFEPDRYGGQWSPYLEQWSIIQAMLPAVAAGGRQLSFWEVLS